MQVLNNPQSEASVCEIVQVFHIPAGRQADPTPLLLLIENIFTSGEPPTVYG